MIESHLPDILKLHGRLGLFNENPIEMVHIYYKWWEKLFSNLKKWRDVVRLKNNRTNLCMTKSVLDPLNEYAKFKMRKRSSSNRGHPVHKSQQVVWWNNEFMRWIRQKYRRCRRSVQRPHPAWDSTTRLGQLDLEGGMEEGDIAAEAGVDNL